MPSVQDRRRLCPALRLPGAGFAGSVATMDGVSSTGTVVLATFQVRVLFASVLVASECAAATTMLQSAHATMIVSARARPRARAMLRITLVSSEFSLP